MLHIPPAVTKRRGPRFVLQKTHLDNPPQNQIKNPKILPFQVCSEPPTPKQDPLGFYSIKNMQIIPPIKITLKMC